MGHRDAFRGVAIDVARGNDAIWLLALFGPAFQREHDVMVRVLLWRLESAGVAKHRGAGTARAVRHRGDHEQAVETFCVAHRFLYRLEVLDAAQRRNRRVTPAVVLDKLSTVRLERAKIRDQRELKKKKTRTGREMGAGGAGRVY